MPTLAGSYIVDRWATTRNGVEKKSTKNGSEYYSAYMGQSMTSKDRC